MQLADVQACLKERIEARLEELMANDAPALLRESMAYSVLNGGKRLRGMLVLMGADLLDVPWEDAVDIACAVEMIHAYSLIHDDLPALDNDTLRRGKPTNHMIYGEAQAILAGDGLLNYAYEVMLKSALAHADRLPCYVRSINAVAVAAGIAGMVGGQVVDVFMEGKPLDGEILQYIHTHKTADLITGALLAGLELGAPTDEQREAVCAYGQNVGHAFQVIDDLLDLVENSELGKTTGKDAKSGKFTYPALYGEEKAREHARRLTEHAVAALAPFAQSAEHLQEMAEDMLSRTF